MSQQMQSLPCPEISLGSDAKRSMFFNRRAGAQASALLDVVGSSELAAPGLKYCLSLGYS